MTASTRSIERERSNSAPAPRKARLAQRRQCRRLSRQAAVYRIRFGSSIPSPEISSYLMSRNTRSDTYIKAGSDSSYDSDECSRRYAEPHLEGYCCMGRISIKKAAMIAGIFSVIQLVLNFCLFLTGCGITMVDIWLAILPLVSGTLAMSFLIFALLRHSPTSLKPYIIYHMMTLIGFFLAFILYILVLFHQSHVIFLLRETASKYSSLAASLENMRIADYQTRLFFGFYLIANLSVSVFCLHIAIGLYLSIDNFLRYLSAECTEIL